MWSRMSLYYYVREMNRTRDCEALYRRFTEAREALYLIERWWKRTRLYQVRNQLYEPAVRRWCEIHDTILYRTGESCRNLWEYHCKKIYPAWSDFLIVMTSSRIVFFFILFIPTIMPHSQDFNTLFAFSLGREWKLSLAELMAIFWEENYREHSEVIAIFEIRGWSDDARWVLRDRKNTRISSSILHRIGRGLLYSSQGTLRIRYQAMSRSVDLKNLMVLYQNLS